MLKLTTNENVVCAYKDLATAKKQCEELNKKFDYKNVNVYDLTSSGYYVTSTELL